jgi:DNA polymerase V
LSFKKAGVILLELTPTNQQQLALWDTKDRERQQQLMQTLDLINTRFGAGTLRFAVAGLLKPWQMKATRKSPRYTTCWQELPIAIA